MTEPLPCPFCGFMPAATVVSYGAIVACSNDDCAPHPRVLLLGRPMADAIERWNKRAPVKLKPCVECGVDMGTSADEQRCQQHS